MIPTPRPRRRASTRYFQTRIALHATEDPEDPSPAFLRRAGMSHSLEPVEYAPTDAVNLPTATDTLLLWLPPGFDQGTGSGAPVLAGGR